MNDMPVFGPDQVSTKTALEDIAIETGTPIEVLFAAGEQAGAQTPDDFLRIARERGQQIGPRFKAGEDPTAIVGELFGPEAQRSFGDYATEIRAQLYGAPATPKQSERPQEANAFRDAPAAIAASVARSGGSIVRGVGEGISAAADVAKGIAEPVVEGALARDVEFFDRKAPNVLSGVADAIGGDKGAAGFLDSFVSEEVKRDVQDFIDPEADLFDPSTWKMGARPTVRGAIFSAVDVFGSMAPIVAAGLLTGNVGAAAMGGLMSGGFAADESGKLIDEMATTRGPDGRTRLEAESSVYQREIAKGATPEEAKEFTKRSAQQLSAVFASVPGALGGAATNAIVQGAGRVAGRLPWYGAIPAAGVISGVEEGAQEVAEGVAARTATNIGAGLNENVTKGTLSEFVVGAMGGAPFGAGAAGIDAYRNRSRANDDPNTGQGNPSAPPGGAPQPGMVPPVSGPGREPEQGVPTPTSDVLRPQAVDPLDPAGQRPVAPSPVSDVLAGAPGSVLQDFQPNQPVQLQFVDPETGEISDPVEATFVGEDAAQGYASFRAPDGSPLEIETAEIASGNINVAPINIQPAAPAGAQSAQAGRQNNQDSTTRFAVGPAIWANADYDVPVIVSDEPPQSAPDGRLYQKISDPQTKAESFVPLDELRPAQQPAQPGAEAAPPIPAGVDPDAFMERVAIRQADGMSPDEAYALTLQDALGAMRQDVGTIAADVEERQRQERENQSRIDEAVFTDDRGQPVVFPTEATALGRLGAGYTVEPFGEGFIGIRQQETTANEGNANDGVGGDGNPADGGGNIAAGSDADRETVAGGRDSAALGPVEQGTAQGVADATGNADADAALNEPKGSPSKTAMFTVATEDEGNVQAKVIRREDGEVWVMREDGTGGDARYNADFARGKTDEEILRYHFEPLGYSGAQPTTPQAALTPSPVDGGAATDPIAKDGLTAESVALEAARIRRRESDASQDSRVDPVAKQEQYLRNIARDNPEQAAAIAKQMRDAPQAAADAAGVSTDRVGAYASIIERQLQLASQNPVKQNVPENQGVAPVQPETAPADQETDPIRAAVRDAIASGPVQHTTIKGKVLDGYILKGMTPAQVKQAFDTGAFFKDGGTFIRKDRAEAFLGADAQSAGRSDINQKAVAKVNAALKPDNKDGLGYYVSGSDSFQIDALGDGDAEITITTSKSRYEGRAKVTSENSQRVKFSDVRDSLSPEARAAVEEFLAFDPDAEPAGRGEVPELLAQARANIARKTKVAEELASAGKPVQFSAPNGQRAIAGPDMSKPGGFRLTRIDADGVPSGHTEFPSLNAAIRAALDENMEPERASSPTQSGNARPKANPQPRLLKRPFTTRIKNKTGGIDPDGPLGIELQSRGLTYQNSPGLFKKGGVKDLDNLPAVEWQDFMGAMQTDDNGYVSQQWIIDSLEAEARGEPVQDAEQERLQRAKDAKAEEEMIREAEAEGIELRPRARAGDADTGPIQTGPVQFIDESDRMDAIREDVRAFEAELGMNVTEQERSYVVARVAMSGGNVEDAFWALFREQAEGAVFNAGQDAESDPIPFPAVSGGTQSGRAQGSQAEPQGNRRSTGDTGSEGGSAAQAPKPGASGEVGPVEGDVAPTTQQAGRPGSVDYPNRKLNMRYARVDAPIGGLGDNSDMSFGNIALANAREGDVLPGVGTVLKVTDKQIQITKPDGAVLRLSQGDKLTGLARDMGGLIASSANLRDEQLGSLMDMIERDPTLTYRDGVPMLFDDPAEQANRGQRAQRGILRPLVPTRQEVDAAAAQADPSPTEAQKEAGNYRKGHLAWNGLDLTIENAKGSERSGIAPDGKSWSVTMPADYGYFKRTESADGDHVDFYMGDVPDSDYVVIINQVDPETQQMDEHKVIIGTTARGAALGIYRDGFSDGSGNSRIGSFTETNVANLKAWLASGETKTPTQPIDMPFAKRNAETQNKTQKSDAPKSRTSVPADDIEVGATLQEGNKGLTVGRFAVFDASGNMISNWEDTAEAARSGARQRLSNRAANEREKAEKQRRYKEIADRLLSGGDVTDADMRILDLKERAQWPYISPVVQELFGISNRKVREAMGSAVFKTTSDMGAVYWNARSRDALKNAAQWVVAQRDTGTKPDTPKRVSAKKAREQQLAKLREYFAPGNIVESYGGTDRVISFNEEDNGDWTVTVEAVRKQGDEWVKDGADTRVRTHSTTPDTRKLAKGPIEKARAAATSAPADPEPTGWRSNKHLALFKRVYDQPNNSLEDMRDGMFPEVAEYADWLGSLTDAQLDAIAPYFRADYNPFHAVTFLGNGGIAEARAVFDPLLAEANIAAPAPTFEPGADGLPQAIMPGMEGGQDQSRAKMTERQRLEFEARKKQTKMRRLGGNDGDAGPLFGNGMDDMFGSGGGLFGAAQPEPQPAPTAADPAPAQTDPIDAALAKIASEGRGPEIADEFRRALTADRRDVEDWKREKANSGGDGSIYDDDIKRAEQRVADVEQRILEEADGIKADKPKAPPKPKADAKSTDKIEDFGEKIGGARKDVWGGFRDRMDAAQALDIKAEPLSKSWPEPDYEKLIEAGVDAWTVGFVRAARESIPRKPSASWKLKTWVASVETLRKFSMDLMGEKISVADVQAKVAASDVLTKNVGNKVDLYMAVGHSKSLKDLKFNAASYSMKDGVYHSPSLVLWEISKDRKATSFSNMPTVLASARTKEEAIAKFKDVHKTLDDSGQKKGSRDKGTKFQIYGRKDGDGKIYSVETKIGKNSIVLRNGITDLDEARRILREEREQLQAQLDRLRDIPNERRDENAPRMGADRRNGADVTPEVFAEAFGFRGIEFGNWVEQGRRQQDLNDAYDALMDMAAILDIPPKAVSLNGALGLAFGARGKGGKNPAAAHFEPGKMVINMTKRAGRGSLAHEWFHALDNYFALKRKQPRGQYITDNNSPASPMTEGVRPETVDAFLAVKRAIAATDLKKRSQEMDRTRTTPYWGTGIEMHARAFESYMLAKLSDQNASNDYLVNVVDNAVWDVMASMQGLGDSYPYLKPSEIEGVRAAFDNLFRVMERRETDRGVAMEMRGDTFPAEVLSDLAGYDDLFRYPTAQGTTIQAVFDEIDPTIEFVGDASRADEQSESGADERFLLRTDNGADFYVFQTAEEVWVNVADLEPGEGGSAIYAAISDYAFNTGRVFIGDPEGLSDAALIRRTDNMLSTAMKHGTTQHIMPHKRQTDGDKKLGVPALRWTVGDDVANLQAMIEVSVANLETDLPEIADARFDFSDGTFRDAKGGLIPHETIDLWGNRLKGSGRAGGGYNTVKRGIVLGSLLRAASRKRPAILEQVLRQSRQVGENLAGAFYMRGDGATLSDASGAPPNTDPAFTEDTRRAVTKALQAEVAKVLPGKRVSVSLVRALYSLKDGTAIMGRANRDGSVQVSERMAGNGAGALGILYHEIVHVLRDAGLWRSEYGMFERGEWERLVRTAEADAGIVASVNKRYQGKGLTREQMQEEYVAEMYRLWKQAVDGYSDVERILLKIEDFFRALASALRGEGFDSAGRIMQRIADGTVGGRDPSGPGRGARVATAGVVPAEMRSAPEAMLSDRVRAQIREDLKVAGRADPAYPLAKIPAVLSALGITDAPLIVRKSVINKAQGKHKLSVDEVLAALDGLADPVMVFDSDTEKDALVALVDVGNEKAVVVAVHPEGEVGRMSVSIVASVHQKDDSGSVARWINSGLLRYNNKRKADTWLQSRRLQLPREGVKHRLGKRILQYRDVFKGGAEMRLGRDSDPVVNPSVMASIARLWSPKPAGSASAMDKKEAGFVSNLLTNAMASNDQYNSLGLVPGEVLFRDLAKNLPSASKWVKTMRQMTAERQEMHAEADVLAREWQGLYAKDKANGRALHDLMHETTIEGLDPSERFRAPRRPQDMTDAQYMNFVEDKRAKHAELRDKFRALPEKMQDIYRRARDAYKAFDAKLIDAMVDAVVKAMDLQAERLKARYEAELQQFSDDGLEGDELKEAKRKARSRFNQDVKMLEFSRNARIRKMRLTYESNRIEGPYFPLMRFGQFFVAARNEKGKLMHFERASTAGAQQRIANEMRAQGFVVETGVMKPEDNISRFVDPNFVADITEAMGEAGADSQILDAIYQRYLETLPSFSIRKANIHRQGVPGFDKDAIRAFGNRMFHGAHQLTRLRHAMDLTKYIESARREAKRQSDPVRAGALVNEMQKRHDWSMNPQGAEWSAWATSAAFVWYLGLTPAAAITNISQTTVVGIPILAAGIKGGTVAKAAKALSGALADFTAGLKKGDKEWSRGALTSGRLSEDERKALQSAYLSGALDKSQAHDIAAIGESGAEYSPIREKVMRPIAFLFHHAERLNREVTFLAAYRMAKESGMDHDAATVKAGDLTWDTHFNYENWSRPRFMQGDVARVIFTFRQFQVNMLYRLFRDTHQALKGESPEVRKQARAQLIGITASMMAHAGITGTWGYALIMLLAGMFMEGGSDEAEEELKNAIVGTFGAGAGGLLLKGIPGHLTGTDMTARMGMPELWFRSPDRQLEGKEAYNYLIEQMLGPVFGIGASVFRGASMVGDGEVWKGTELMVPKAIRDQLRFVRYMNEGVTTYKGDPLLDDISAHDAIVQAIGFSPARVSERYEQNRRLMNAQTRIEDERRKILSDITRYIRDGQEISPRALRRRDEFNAKYPTFAITGETIRRSYRARMNMSEQMDGGIRINPKLDRYLRDNMAPTINN